VIGPLLLALLAADCEAPPLRLSARAAVQGNVLVVEAPSAVEATWNGRAVRFWREGKGGPFRALLGIDLEQPAGKVELRQGECRIPVEVGPGDFEVKHLRVGKRYVKLSARDQARVRREAARLQAIFAGVSPRAWEGAFRHPVNAPPSPNFGQRRILNGEPRSPHGGVDFSARAGAPVDAPARGRVVLASPLFFSGRTVILDHGLGLFTFYGHLRSIAVRSGQVVEAGGRLGEVGATGRATGPHLHWAVRLQGARVDPLALVGVLSAP
jgi:murein DD-endopeptidase MepM/ murein hydrolase activator NlpD